MPSRNRFPARSVLRAAFGAICLPLAAIALWFCAGLLGAIVPSAGEAPGDAVEVRLVGTALHYDFLLPATPETRAAFAFAAARGVPLEAPGVEWVLAGWGARDFYTGTPTLADVRPGPVWRAITGDASVLRVDVWGPVAGDGTLRLRLSSAQYTRLLAAIVATLADPTLVHPEPAAPDLADPEPAEAGFTPTDAFFAARGRFDGFRTCNTWVGAMLRAAGVRFGVWTPTPQAVRLSVALHSATS